MASAVGGQRQAVGPRPDDGHAVAVALRRAERLLVGVVKLPVADEALEFADGYRLGLDAQDAGALALRLLRAYAAADGGQRAVAGDDVGRTAEFAGVQRGDEVGNVDVDGAGRHAARIAAVQAARRLEHRLLGVVAVADLVEIGGPHLRVLFAYGYAGYSVVGHVVLSLDVAAHYLSSPMRHLWPASRSARMAAARASSLRYMP